MNDMTIEAMWSTFNGAGGTPFLGIAFDATSMVHGFAVPSERGLLHNQTPSVRWIDPKKLTIRPKNSFAVATALHLIRLVSSGRCKLMMD